MAKKRRYCHHGLSNHPLYSSWLDIKQRCYNPNDNRYHDYGKRNIKICKEWKEDAANFIQWALENGWKKGLYLDREDNNRGYSPNNCRFVNIGLSNRNTQLLRKDNKTGYRGVNINKRDQKFQSSIRVHGKKKSLGYFSNPIHAAIAYDRMANLLNDGRPINFKNGGMGK
ncbi:hypothetical protein LCGC14_0911010 [marine sediment metagenome]|uniref:AP2/ERF domain-containing protein n=1 Tax=marine sediment metagenome TaxID=412755 RepID=A0A0F9NTR0_9ZZZZ|nr:hypothetical protein [Candidatus Aminicenantes bacterium]